MSEMAAMGTWVVSCVLCGKVVEAGTQGSGVMRYHCQDLDKTDIDQRCYEQFSAVRQALAAAATGTWRRGHTMLA